MTKAKKVTKVKKEQKEKVWPRDYEKVVSEHKGSNRAERRGSKMRRQKKQNHLSKSACVMFMTMKHGKN